MVAVLVSEQPQTGEIMDVFPAINGTQLQTENLQAWRQPYIVDINIPSPYKIEEIRKPHYHHDNNALASFRTGMTWM